MVLKIFTQFGGRDRKGQNYELMKRAKFCEVGKLVFY